MPAYYFEELIKIELFKRHECCNDSRLYLFPPNSGGEIGNTIKYKVTRRPSWYIDVDNENIDVNYCPWCGIKLPTAES